MPVCLNGLHTSWFGALGRLDNNDEEESTQGALDEKAFFGYLDVQDR